ncbi:MAG: hypothetical protein ACI9XK_000568 [Granulosicoccus sp.]|jgi:hypothetical protein
MLVQPYRCNHDLYQNPWIDHCLYLSASQRHRVYRKSLKLVFLRTLSVPMFATFNISFENLVELSQRCRSRRASKLKMLREPIRTLEIACFLRHTLLLTTDTILYCVIFAQPTCDVMYASRLRNWSILNNKIFARWYLGLVNSPKTLIDPIVK